MKFRNTVTGKEYAASVGASQSLIPFAAPEIEDDIGEIGGLFALELPAGTYSVYSWGIKQGEWFLAPMKAFDIPFTIEAGSSVYLGNFHIEQTDKKLFRTGAAKMSLRNNASRDIPALQKRFKVFQTLPISTVIAADANFEELGSGSKGKFEFSGPLFVPNYKPK